jgi:hypothetical protein
LLWAGGAQASYWTLVAAAVLLIVGRPDFTWTFYAPMSLRVGGPLVWMGYFAIVLVAVSEFLAGAVLLRNVMAWRAGWRKLPIMGWAMFSEALLLLLSTPLLALVGLFLFTDWIGATALFDPARGGSVKTFLWMFWFYGHPAVYLPLVPAIAVVYTLLPRFLGRPMWSTLSAVIAFLLLVALSFVVFHHHFQPDVTTHTWVQRAFQILTLFIFIPSTLHVFNWIATLWQDHIPDSARAAAPFKFTIGAIFFHRRDLLSDHRRGHRLPQRADHRGQRLHPQHLLDPGPFPRHVPGLLRSDGGGRHLLPLPLLHRPHVPPGLGQPAFLALAARHLRQGHADVRLGLRLFPPLGGGLPAAGPVDHGPAVVDRGGLRDRPGILVLHRKPGPERPARRPRGGRSLGPVGAAGKRRHGARPGQVKEQ